MKVYFPFSLIVLAPLLPSTAATAGKLDRALQELSANPVQLATSVTSVTSVNYYDVHRKKRGHHSRHYFKRKHHKKSHHSRRPHPWYGRDYQDYRSYRGYRGYRDYRRPYLGRYYRYHQDYRHPQFLRYHWRD